jgi:DNA-binding response OmpR family regulator
MARASVLVVDDDLQLGNALAGSLRFQGYDVDQAADGAQALQRLATVEVDLLVTDIAMPVLDGFELMMAVRQQHPSMRILAISAPGQFGGLDLLWMAKVIGADATLTKPFSIDAALTAIAGLLGEPRGLPR